MNATLPNTNPLLEAALAAQAADLCVIPAKGDGSKAPFGNWKQYQAEQPSPDDLLGWFGGGRYVGMGVVCGAVSGRLECLEIEGVFAFRYQELRDRLEGAGLLEEWDRWLEGYAERSPSGGIHVLVRIEGEGEVPGNTKLALGPFDETLGKCPTWIETRGEGGFVIVAPSGGSVHPSGKPWLLKSGSFDEIAHTTLDLWDAIVDVCCSFDESPAATTAPPTLPRQPYTGEGWIGAALADHPDLVSVLRSHGWTYVRDEPLGQLWRRPGKQHGHSARINSSGRLVNFSSSTPLPIGRQTFDAVDVELAYRLGRMPTLDERTAALREFKPASASTSTSPALLSGRGTSVEGTEAGSGLNLPDEFWLERPYLSHVYAAANAEAVPPDALWMSTKVLYAAAIPYTFRLPGDGTFDYIGLMVGNSGDGKSASYDAAMALFPDKSLPLIELQMPEPASGEGIVEAFIKRDKDGEQSIRYRGAAFYIDEGRSLLDTSRRNGSTTLSILRSAWSGKMIGTVAASADKRRKLPMRGVRVAMNIGIQPAGAAEFMSADMTDGGLPQRICWAMATFPNVRREDLGGEHPGLLPVPVYPTQENVALTTLTYVDELRDIVTNERFSRLRGDGTAPLNGQETLAKLKSAAIHALMDGRFEVTMNDWTLAQIEWDVSERIRANVLATQRNVVADRNRARGIASAHEEIARDEVFLERAIMVVARKVQKADSPVSANEIREQLGSSYRKKGVGHVEAIEAAAARGLIAKSGDGYTAGAVRL